MRRPHRTESSRIPRPVGLRALQQSLLLAVVPALVGPACATADTEAPADRGSRAEAQVPRPIGEDAEMTPELVERMAQLALDCVDREYPNKISHVLASDADVAPPRLLTPAFFGCFDWHSSVHGHWLLARLARRHPEAPFAAAARDVLNRHLTTRKILSELAYLTAEVRASWERPYGLAWLLQLASELHEWAAEDPTMADWSKAIEPLELAVASRLGAWLPKLDYPIRTGEHSQTAFAFGLMLDWAERRGEQRFAELVRSRSLDLYGNDTGWSFRFEPGGQDFLSPGLASADLMRRVLGPEDFADWLTRALPDIPSVDSPDWLPVAKVSDRSDGKLAHLDGLNLSRAWMLGGIAQGLPASDPRRRSLEERASAHRAAGLDALSTTEYAGGHWLGSFATYLVTGRGL